MKLIALDSQSEKLSSRVTWITFFQCTSNIFKKNNCPFLDCFTLLNERFYLLKISTIDKKTSEKSNERWFFRAEKQMKL